MIPAIRTLSIAALLALALPAWAHPGHDHHSLSHALLHLLFGLHGWPTPLAWALAIGGAAAAALACRGLHRRWTARRQQPTVRPDTPPHPL